MPPTKRKRPHDEEQPEAVSDEPGRARRVTRQTANHPPPLSVPPNSGPRRRSLRAHATAMAHAEDDTGAQARPKTRLRRVTGEDETALGKRGRSRATDTETSRATRRSRRGDTAKTTRRTRHTAVVEATDEDEDEDGDEEDNVSPVSTKALKTPMTNDNRELSPATSSKSSGTKTGPSSPIATRPQPVGGQPTPAQAQAQAQVQVQVQAQTQPPPLPTPKLQKSKPKPSSSTLVPRIDTPLKTTSSSSTTAAAMRAPPSPGPGQPDRNIDKVVLGKICFRAWYPSYYGKEVLGETSAHTHHHGKGGSSHHSHSSHHGHGHSAHGSYSTGKDGHHGAHRHAQPILDRLYVCPFCFKYSKEIVPWWGHVQLCERQFQMPGEKVYVHPKGVRTVRVPIEPTTKGRRRRATGEQEVQYIEQIVKDEGEWSVWEVDGEKDVLFCQNLSLFAKLFLDNKSVFFDVTGFHYFLLVYTPPQPAPAETAAVAGAAAAPTDDGALLRSRVVGFFSKEKMSWDNNNLACILVFPPWQRKGLGSLLMGLSYEISRREEVLGGPEKPISDLGKKGYKRFWAGEIARWLLGLDEQELGSGVDNEDKVLVIDTEDCSRATYIAREDCLLVLREMGIAEDAGMGPPKGRCVLDAGAKEEHGEATPEPTSAGGGKAAPVTGGGGATAAAAAAAAAASTAAASSGALATSGGPASDKQDTPKEVRRVCITKAAVRQWIAKHRISLELACDPAGFIKVYTKKDLQQPAIDK